MKVFTLTWVVALLLIATSSAAKPRRGEKRTTSEDNKKSTEWADAAKANITATVTDEKEKAVHKRGILHYGGSLAATGGLWPKNYASHYGSGLHWPAASGFSVHPLSASHLHAPSLLKYNSGFRYKALNAPSVLSGVYGLDADLPSYAGLSPAAIGHVHQTAQPFIIRPGGAVVQSYSVNYPHRKAAVAVRPAHAFASLAPVQPAAAVQPVHAFQTVQHTQTVQPLQPVAAIQPVAAAIQPVQPVHHHLPPVQPVQHLHPVPPVQTVVQVQHFKPPPPVHYDVTQQFPSFFQTSFVPPAPVPAIPQAPTVPFSPAQPAFPAIPTFPNPPAFPSIPSVPVIPPGQPSIPDVPAVPAIPNIPTIPSIPNFPQPQVPANGFFPASVQPPLNQKPPPFAAVSPQGQFPGFVPIVGNNPDTGSADAAPQIPQQPLPIPEPELPAFQPEPTQQPWKPVTFEPSTVESPVGPPANTLLPPYGNSLSPGYLPPASSTLSGSRSQQEYTIDTSLFDSLSDADIQQIFSQASLAAERDHHHHHTVHNYHSHY